MASRFKRLISLSLAVFLLLIITVGQFAVDPATFQSTISSSKSKISTNSYGSIDYSTAADGYVKVKYTAQTDKEVCALIYRDGKTSYYSYTSLTPGADWTLIKLPNADHSYSIQLREQNYDNIYYYRLTVDLSIDKDAASLSGARNVVKRSGIPYSHILDLHSHGILSQEDVFAYVPKQPVTLKDAISILAKTQYAIEHPNTDFSKFVLNLDEYCRIHDLTEYAQLGYTQVIDRGTLACLAHRIADADTFFTVNNIAESYIPDIPLNDPRHNAIYTMYRWGLMSGTDAAHNFSPDAPVTYDQLIIVADLMLNPNVRATFSNADPNEASIQSDAYPMTYSNQTKGLNIEVTKEKYFEAVCYVAHVTMTDPSHLKTIYSGLNWNMNRAAISTVNEAVDSILMINGDFRDTYCGKDLGIVRNRRIVNDLPVNGIALHLDGTFKSIKNATPKALLASGVRETFTFGPILLDGTGRSVFSSNTDRHPRTFIGQVYRSDDILEYYLIVADGRQPGYSMGLTNNEMSSILAEKGCDFGYNLDGGGSSAMMFNGKLLNRPSDGQERKDADYLYIK